VRGGKSSQRGQEKKREGGVKQKEAKGCTERLKTAEEGKGKQKGKDRKMGKRAD